MITPSPAALRRSLAQLRRRGKAVDVPELAQRLLSLRDPAPPPVARRIVATALGCSEGSLPERIEARHLRPVEERAVVDLPLEQAVFHVVDLETTGLSIQRAHILEIGAVRIEGLQRSDRFATLVRPPHGVPPSITALTGIHDALVADAPGPGEALGAFRRWLARGAQAAETSSRDVFVAHNARFDAGFVDRALEEHALPPYRAPVLCTRRLACRILPGLGRYNLDQLCAQLGLANPARHRATGDAEVTARALIEMIERAREREGTRSVGDLLEIQERPTRRRRRSGRRSRRQKGQASTPREGQAPRPSAAG